VQQVVTARGRNIDRVLVTGSGSDNPVGKRIFSEITALYQIGFDFPPDAEYTTAIGAALSG
jgi:type II pantothenate kinase